MKKNLIFALVLSFSTLLPERLNADNASANCRNSLTTTTVENKKAQVLLQRLDEIEAIDKTVLSPVERRILRKEVRQTKAQLRELSGGVYLSAGAVILILILLIILI